MPAPLLTRKHFKQLAELAKVVSLKAGLTKSQTAILVKELSIFCNGHNHKFDYTIFQAMVFGERLPKMPMAVRQPTLINFAMHLKTEE